MHIHAPALILFASAGSGADDADWLEGIAQPGQGQAKKKADTGGNNKKKKGKGKKGKGKK
jgi:hypothetical protein